MSDDIERRREAEEEAARRRAEAEERARELEVREAQKALLGGDDKRDRKDDADDE